MVKIPMKMHNVFRIANESEKDTERNANARVFPFMVPLIERLSRKNPHWEFHATQYARTSDDETGIHYYAYHKIMENDEELGWINCEQRSAGMSYIYDSPRLRSSRTRGYSGFTKDVTKATKQILGAVYTKTLPERMQEAKALARSSASTLRNATLGRLQSLERELSGSFKAFSVARWDEFLTTLKPKLAGSAVEYPDIRVEEKDAHALYEMGSTDRGYVVILDSADKYHVSQNFNNAHTVTTYTTETVPPLIKQGIGMLKLLEVGKAIYGIGIRVGVNHFYVVTPDAEETPTDG